MRKVKLGSGKHKGKLPFICFDCGRIGNFVAKCPYEKREDGNDEENNVKEEQVVRKIKTGSGNFKEREDNDDKEESLSITMEEKYANEENEDSEKEDINGEVNLEEKLVSALEEINRMREENI